MKDFKKVGIKIFLSNCNANIRGMFARIEILKKAKDDVIFVDVHRAVKAALEESAPLELEEFEKDSIKF